MLFATAHGTFLAMAEDGQWLHVPSLFDPSARPVQIEGSEFIKIEDAPGRYRVARPEFAGVVFALRPRGFALRRGGKFLSAAPEQALLREQEACQDWEIFWPVDQHFNGETEKSFSESELNRFRRKVESLVGAGQPVKVHLACGIFPRKDFLNIDISIAAPDFFMSDWENYFIFRFADTPWGIPENSVDYIFHEDFIEHIDQTSQLQILAEALRVLKPGEWHRVNTPDLLWAMKTHSDFGKGLAGVYTGERQWEHISMLTPVGLKDLAMLVGYRHVVFNRKNGSASKYAVPDVRPFSDRDEVLGNIYADLLK